ncbi:MAG: SLOG family protein [Oscillospiraceae bacterium]|nr:SLOG family protein [Oscillospiraceae bacterium]
MHTFIPIARENTCCFSGYRPEKLPWRGDEADARCVSLKKDIDRAAERAYADGMRHFVCGMARGCDMYFCESVMALRTRLGGVTVEAAVPHDMQSAGWPAADAARYDRLLALCDIRTVVSGAYSRGAMAKRNRYMVNRSSMLVAVYDGQPGGTGYTVAYAGKRGVKTIILPPPT